MYLDNIIWVPIKREHTVIISLEEEKNYFYLYLCKMQYKYSIVEYLIVRGNGMDVYSNGKFKNIIFTLI